MQSSSSVARGQHGAALLLTKSLGLVAEDRFLLVYDETTLRFPQLFKAAAASLAIDYVGRFISRREQIARTAFNGEFEQQMDRVEGILLAVTADPEADGFRIEMADRHRGSATVASMPGASVELLATALDVDYDEIASMCRHLTIPLLKGDDCCITTCDREGRSYELGLRLGGHLRKPVQSLGVILPRGGWGNPCAGETFIAPLEGTAEGEYLVNGAVGSQKVVGSEALLTFREGRLVRHRHLRGGGPVAHLERLERIARDQNVVETWNVLAELGVGVNRAIRRIIGVEVIDEKKYGTVHIAIGHNETFGGRNICHPIHCDITTQNPRVAVDGHLIIDGGCHLADVSPFLEDHRLADVPDERRRALATADVWPLPEHFDLDEAGRLLVVSRTPSGRRTVYQPFVNDTGRLAAALVSSGATIGGTEEREAFCAAHGMSAIELDNLLHLLETHRVIRVIVES